MVLMIDNLIQTDLGNIFVAYQNPGSQNPDSSMKYFCNMSESRKLESRQFESRQF